jgi:hypothetical protein
VSESSDKAPAWIGLVVIVAALVPYLAASNVIPSDDEDFGAPRWVVAWLVIVCFFLPGNWILGGGDPGTAVGFVGRCLAAIFPTALAIHAASHAFIRVGPVALAWLLLSALLAWVAARYWRGLLLPPARQAPPDS